MSRPSKNGGLFQALQDMYENPILQKLAVRKRRTEEILAVIKDLPLNVVDSEPDWKWCINVSGPELDQEMAFNMAASKIETMLNITPLELRTMTKDDIATYWFKTGN